MSDRSIELKILSENLGRDLDYVNSKTHSLRELRRLKWCMKELLPGVGKELGKPIKCIFKIVKLFYVFCMLRFKKLVYYFSSWSI